MNSFRLLWAIFGPDRSLENSERGKNDTPTLEDATACLDRVLEGAGLLELVVSNPAETGPRGLQVRSDDGLSVITLAEVDEKAGGRLDHYLYGVKALLKKDIEHVLPGRGFPVADHGKRVIELTYESLMLKLLKVEDKIPWISGAEALARQGLLEEAVFCCDKALAANPENMRALQVKAMCLADLGRGEEAIEVLDVMLAREGQDPFALTTKGNALLGLGKYEESLEYLNRAIEVAPQIQEAQVYKGMALYLLGRYDEAMDIEVFSKEFAGHLKTDLEKLAQEKGSQEAPKRGCL